MSSSTSTPIPPSLLHGTCQPCKKGTPRGSYKEIRPLYDLLGGQESGWRVELVGSDEDERVQVLLKSYPFKDFRTALAFTNLIGALAEEHKHHPRLITEWGSVEVGWTTHAISGLHHNDFVMAAKTEQLARDAELGEE